MNKLTNCLFVDLQGFKSFKNEFIVKELAIGTNECTQVFLIKPPYPFYSLTESEKRHVRYIERNKGIMWREGYIDYKEFKRTAANYLLNKKIFVKGSEKIKWVKDLCENCTVIDLGEKGSPNLQMLHENYTTSDYAHICIHHKKVCALKNVMCIKKWYFDNHMYLFNSC